MATESNQKGYTKVSGLFIFGFEDDTVLALSDSLENFIFIHVNKKIILCKWKSQGSEYRISISIIYVSFIPLNNFIIWHSL
jgi:hypothetical protein